MFRNIKLNPFSAPSDPKLTFRSTQVPRLYSERAIPASDVDFWACFYTVFDTPYDVLHLLTAADITRTLQAHRENLVTLIQVLADRIEHLLRHGSSDSKFPTPSKSAAQGFAAYNPAAALLHAQSPEEKANDTTRQMLNCLRVLQRVIPFVLSAGSASLAHEYEDAASSGYGSSLEEDVFWKARRKNAAAQVQEVSTSAGAQFVIDDEEEEGPSSSRPAPSKEAELPPLAEQLLDSAVDLLFVQGFTLPSATEQGGGKAAGGQIAYTIWENGIGSTTSVPVTPETDKNRSEVLRFLLALLSRTLYVPTNAYTANALPGSTSTLNKWHAYLVRTPSTPKARKVVLSLLCSLLNVALKSGSYHATASSGLVGAVGGAVGDSYEKLLSGGKRKDDPPRLGLVKVAVQVLNVLLCTPTEASLRAGEASRQVHAESVRSPPMTPSLGSTSMSQQASTTSLASALASAPRGSAAGGRPDANAFQFFLSKLHRQSDVGFIVENLLVILLQPMNTSFLKLPFEAVGVASTASPTQTTDFLILLWRLLDSIPNFASALLSNGKNAHQVMIILVYFCLEHKDDPSQLGLVKLAAFLLQTISAERSFGSSLNVPLDAHIPLPSRYSVPAPSTAADSLIQHLYTLVFSTQGALNAIYPAFILTITNVSPYLKNPSVRTSTRLLQLFLAMSNPGFLLSDEANPRLVFYLLEAFNNVLQYQLSDCPNLVYSIIRSHARFEELANFTVANGVASIRRARRGKAGADTASVKSPPRVSLASEQAPREGGEAAVTAPADEEKAALMQQEKDVKEAENVAAPVSPTTPSDSEYPPRQTRAGKILSEKAAGKLPMRSNSQLSVHSAASGESGAGTAFEGTDDDGPFVAKNGFMPTEAWVASWREGLPIDTILILVSECLPKVSSLAALSTNTAVLEYLRSVTLVGLLPPPAPIRARRFVHSLHSVVWLMSLAWGNVYVHSLAAPGAGAGVWQDTGVRLFALRQRNDRGGVQAVMSSLVEQGLGILSLGGGGAAGTGSGASSPVARRSTNRSRSTSSVMGGIV